MGATEVVGAADALGTGVALGTEDALDVAGARGASATETLGAGALEAGAMGAGGSHATKIVKHDRTRPKVRIVRAYRDAASPGQGWSATAGAGGGAGGAGGFAQGIVALVRAVTVT